MPVSPHSFINKANPTIPKIQEIIEDKKIAIEKEDETKSLESATVAMTNVQTGASTSKSGTLTPPQTPGKAKHVEKEGRKQNGQSNGDAYMPLTPPKDA